MLCNFTLIFSLVAAEKAAVTVPASGHRTPSASAAFSSDDSNDGNDAVEVEAAAECGDEDDDPAITPPPPPRRHASGASGASGGRASKRQKGMTAKEQAMDKIRESLKEYAETLPALKRAVLSSSTKNLKQVILKDYPGTSNF